MSAGAPDLFAHGTKSGIMSDIDNGVIQVLSHTQKLDFFFFSLQAPSGQCHMTEQMVNRVFGDCNTDFFPHRTEAFLHSFLSHAINPSSH